MMSWQWLIAVFLFLVGMALYLPLIYLRKWNAVLEVLEAIERNTRFSRGTQSMARFIVRAVMAEKRD